MPKATQTQTLAEKRAAAMRSRESGNRAPAPKSRRTAVAEPEPEIVEVEYEEAEPEEEVEEYEEPEEEVEEYEEPETVEPIAVSDDSDDEDDEPFGAEDIPPAVTRTPLNVSGRTSQPTNGRSSARAIKPLVKGGALAKPLIPRNRLLGAEDLIVPKLKGAQGLSKAVQSKQVELGEWYLTGMNKPLGNVTYIIPVDMIMSRSMWKTGVGVLCRSFDLVQGIGDPGVLCEGTQEEIEDPQLRPEDRGCEFRLWDTGENNRRIPPPCGKAYNYPVLVLELPEDDTDGDLENAIVHRSMLTMRSTWSAAAKIINTAVMNSANPQWHRNVFQLELVSKSNMSGTFYVPDVEHLGETPPSLVRQAEAYAATVSNQYIRANMDSMDDE